MTEKRPGPERTCIVCRGRFPKNSMTRYVFQGDLREDVAATAPGRGYYCCAGAACRAGFARRAAAVRKRKGEGTRDEA